MTILDAIQDDKLFRPLFKDLDTWQAWLVVLRAIFALPMEEADLALYRTHTGRQQPPTQPVNACCLICGRRSGKSFIVALIAVFLTCFHDYRAILGPGERGVVMVIATDRKQARVIMRYLTALLESVPMLALMIERADAESIDLNNQVSIEIHTASFRSVRGYTVLACLLDELSFWPTEDSANPDTEILAALRPAMATVPNALLLMISTPYSRKGELWKAYKDHFGKEHDPMLVWQADTRTMNPTVPQVVIDSAYADDPASAAAEYGGEFRKDIQAFIPREVVAACVIAGRYELPMMTGVMYAAFVDPSGGSQDAMTLAIAHQEQGTAVLDCVREVQPPFSPEQVVADFAATLKRYAISRVVGDRYGGEWCREPFRKHGIFYDVSEKTRSDLYCELLPMLNSGTVALLDHPRLIAQCCALERRTARGGKDSVDHPPHSHDDLINSVAGALVGTAMQRVPGVFVLNTTW